MTTSKEIHFSLTFADMYVSKIQLQLMANATLQLATANSEVNNLVLRLISKQS